MSLDNIQLPPLVLQQLFKDSLIELNQPSAKIETTLKTNFNMLGKYGKQVLILVDNDEVLYLPDEELNFLTGILNACKLTMDDVGISNVQKNESMNYQLIAGELKPTTVLMFGVSPSRLQLPLSFPQYQIQRYNSFTFLSAPLLAIIQNNKEEKVLLWNCLKQIFL